MREVLELYIVKGVTYSRCNKILERIRRNSNLIVVSMGSLNECSKIIQESVNIVGIADVYDDVSIIRMLKNRDSYIAGHWKNISSDICIGGIDGRNPIQNLEMLSNSIPEICRNLVLVSPYPIKYTLCSFINILGKKISIGIDLSKLLEKISIDRHRIVYISYNNLIDRICIDRINDSFIHIHLGGDSPIIIKILFSSIVGIEYAYDRD